MFFLKYCCAANGSTIALAVLNSKHPEVDRVKGKRSGSNGLVGLFQPPIRSRGRK